MPLLIISLLDNALILLLSEVVMGVSSWWPVSISLIFLFIGKIDSQSIGIFIGLQPSLVISSLRGLPLFRLGGRPLPRVVVSEEVVDGGEGEREEEPRLVEAVILENMISLDIPKEIS